MDVLSPVVSPQFSPGQSDPVVPALEVFGSVVAVAVDVVPVVGLAVVASVGLVVVASVGLVVVASVDAVVAIVVSVIASVVELVSPLSSARQATSSAAVADRMTRLADRECER